MLVGHSYGGAVISNAARGVRQRRGPGLHRRVRPRHRRDPGAAGDDEPWHPHHPDALDARPYPLPDGGTGIDLYIKAEVFRDAFAGDLPRRTTNLMQATQRPFSVAAFTEPSGDPAWKTIPSWYLVATNDHAIPPPTQRFMADRAGSVDQPRRRLPRPDAVPAQGHPGHHHDRHPRSRLTTAPTA